MTKAGVIAADILCIITAILSVFAGVWIIYDWRDVRYCNTFVIFQDDDWYRYGGHGGYADDDYAQYISNLDRCKEAVWAAIAFIDGLLWALAAMCITYVLCSGKFDAMVSKLNDEDVAAEQPVRAIEMGTMQHSLGVATAVTVSTSPTTPDKAYGNF
eukprot:CAMPEP_0194035184 /NCGR_PEP_ID=MMETSP0009_2-20130614/7651_1 /TAXON_ID=210454 /ORGANISM="Grammatophora oceanica, Strain CCMP 410" /LENGTH=156 /DNA_ID=CAMNT_0038676449 /DNA_START=227 /DNA_END=697 /DNA_ORIENTATION=-